MKKKISFLISLIVCLCMMLPIASFADALIVDPSPIEYDYQDTDFYVVVSAPDDYVNHRTGPGLTYNPPIQRVYNGTELHIIATCENARDGQTWGKCNYNGETGWVSTNQCTKIAKPTEPATTEETTPETTVAPTTEETTTAAPETTAPTTEETTTVAPTTEETTAPSVIAPAPKPEASGISYVVILIVLGVVGVALIAVIILLIVFMRKRK